MIQKLLQDLQRFTASFQQAGYKIYLVGGAVRDLMMNQRPKDLDFTTDAEPEQVCRLFRKVIPTGIKHGTVTVLFGQEKYEVTTFRTDGEYLDARRPEQVSFTKSLAEDLKRRDLTINALALDLDTGEIIDFHDGRADLSRQILRCIGRPEDRFSEDALRMFRVCRFSAQLGFDVDPMTWSAVLEKRNLVTRLSRERIREELEKILKSPYPLRGLNLLLDSGILTLVLPDQVSPPTEKANLPTSLSNLGSVDWVALCAAFFSRYRKPPEGNQSLLTGLKYLTFSNQVIATIQQYWQIEEDFHQEGVPQLLLDHWGSRQIEPLRAYLKYLGEELNSRPKVNDYLASLERILENHDPIFLRDLALGGKDLIATGYPAGPELRTILEWCQHQVWSNPGLNQKEGLLALVKQKFSF